MSDQPLNIPETTIAPAPPAPKQPPKPTVADRLREELPSMRTAVVWSEILDKPLSRRNRR